MMFGWFHNRSWEVRQLNRDARNIVEMAEHTYRADRQVEIARLVKESLAQIEQVCGDGEACRERELDRVKSRHREARRQMNQIALTGHTLTIIHLRATAMGAECQSALDAIDGFVARWAHATDDDSVLSG